MALSGMVALKAQMVAGTVTSSDGPLSGVNIIEKGTTNGTTTDANGKYSIILSKTNGSLVFSSIMFVTKEERTNGRAIIDVRLEQDMKALEQVIVTAYGTSKRSQFTGASSVVKSKDIQKIQISSVTTALAGSVTGVQVQTPDATPGSSPQIRIRGISSINGVSDPLYVVNGAPFGGDLNSIDPNDVESITVLKDASATALYGSRAASGVVLITTKKGRGNTVVNFKQTFGVTDQASPLHKRVNNAQYYEMRWEANKNGYMDQNPTATLAQAEAWAHANTIPRLGGYNSYDKYPLLPNGRIDPTAKPRWGSGPTDWENLLLAPGPRYESSLSLSGANEKGLSYFASFGYLNDKGYVTTQEFDRYSGRVDVSGKVGKVFEMGINTSFAQSKFVGPRFVRHQYGFALDMPDIYPAYQWDDASNTFKQGNDRGKVYDLGGGNQFSYNRLTRGTWANVHGLQQADDDIMRSIRTNLSVRPYISVTPFQGFTIMSQFAADFVNEMWKFYGNSFRGLWAGVGGEIVRNDNSNFVYTSTTTATYMKSFGNHSIDVLGGVEAYSLRFNNVQSSAQRFAVPTLNEIGAAGLITGGFSLEDNHRLLSYLSRVQYSYQGKYFLSASFRRDGTSRFASENRWGNFGSLGSSWIMSKEKFFDGAPSWINDATVRFSIGSQGNERIGNYYAYLGTYNISSDLGASALSLRTLSNNLLRWETNLQTNYGLTTRLFDRININFDYWVKKSNDLLFSRALPLSSGVGAVDENIGDVQNKGFDLEIVADIMPLSSKFKWEVSLGLSHYTNKITKLPNEINTGYYRYKEGVSVFEYYLREWSGVNPANGSGSWTNSTGGITENINEAAFDFRGTALPDFFGFWKNTFNYKSFDLSVNIIYNVGGQIYDARFQTLSHAGSRNLAETFAAENYDFWTPQNKNATQTRLTFFGAKGNPYHQNSTRYLVDATYARFRNITLGYILPRNPISKIGLTNARIFLQADNFITFFGMKKRGLDPEIFVSGQGPNVATPSPAKIASAGISITF